MNLHTKSPVAPATSICDCTHTYYIFDFLFTRWDRTLETFLLCDLFSFVGIAQQSLVTGAAVLADSSPALPVALCVDARPKSDIRQRDLLKNIVGIKPKRPKVGSPLSQAAAESDRAKQNQEVPASKVPCQDQPFGETEKVSSHGAVSCVQPFSKPAEATEARPQNVCGSLLGLAYESSDEE
uniref:Uncharacterized protein n=1 Tax=Avena sativa TaxID=4498 RepID=A0ACD5UH72_AVESA